MNPDDIIVTHDPEAGEFTAQVGDDRAVLEYREYPGRIVFSHTEVPVAVRHMGIADKLSHAGLEYARGKRLTVVPICPFVAAYMRRHPEYQSLVDEQWRSHAGIP